MKRLVIYSVLVVSIATVAVIGWWHAKTVAAWKPPVAQKWHFPPVVPGSEKATVDPNQWPHPDTLDVHMDAAQSLWIESEKKRFAALLKQKPCDTLVVPVQSQDFGFDRATRSLMTAQLAALVASDSSRCVADPYVVARALGDGMRRFDASAVDALASALGAKTIVSAYAGHDNHMNMALFVRTEAAQHGGYGYRETKSKSWPQIPFTDEAPPFVAWLSTLKEVASEFGFKNAVVAPPPESEDAPEIPAKLEQVTATPSTGPLNAAHEYEFLAMLAPGVDSRASERLFEKAWLSASRATDSGESRRVRARALFHLGYRPAAMALLKGDDTADGRLLLQLLNGNFPESLKTASEIQSERGKVFAAIEIRDLALAYGRTDDREAAEAILKKYEAQDDAIGSLLGARAGDRDPWKADDNHSVKSILDTLYPIDGFTFDEYVRGRLTVGEAPSEAALDGLPVRHIHRLIEQTPARFCCDGDRTLPNSLDVLDVLAARSVANIEKKIVRMVKLQDQVEAALQQLDELEGDFSGHPHFAALRAEALIEVLSHRMDQQAPERQRRALEESSKADFFEQGSTQTAADALITMGVPSGGSMPYLRAYDSDFPPKPYWYATSVTAGYVADKALAEALLRYSASNTRAVDNLARFQKVEDSLLNQTLQDRFHGARSLSELRARFAQQSSNSSDNEALRQQVEADPGDWKVRHRLVTALIEQADYDGALKIAQEYPGFKPNSGENAVALSNYEADVASNFFWRGALQQAETMYRMAAAGETGAEAEMVARQRLQLLDGHYLESAQFAAQRVARYGGAYAIRDYLGMLFAFDDSKDAWAAFSQSARQQEFEELWMAALVGHRVDGATTKKFETWLDSDLMRAPTRYGDIPALKVGIAWFLIDRPRDPTMPGFMAKLEGEQRTLEVPYSRTTVERPLADDSGRTSIRRSAFRQDTRELPAKEHTIPSEIVLFAKAYDSFSSGDHATAVQEFDRLATYYAVEGISFGVDAVVSLPYFAFSAAKTGDALGLKPFLAAIPADQQRENVHLALAYFAGLGGQPDEATKQLALALGKIEASHGVTTVVTYQYAETCVRLFDETHDTRYRDLALDWARKYQRIDPTMAWAYALEARYGDPNDKGHIRAVALAQYLDRNSYWLSGVPKADQDRAREWFKRNNPFKMKPRSGSDV